MIGANRDRNFRRSRASGRVRGILLAALFLTVLPSAPLGARAEAIPLGPGCDSTRPAVAHHSGGVLIGGVLSPAPIPCGVTTGYATSENHIVVSKTGAVFYAPAVSELVPGAVGCPVTSFLNSSCTGLARTTDLGATWTNIVPTGAFDVPYYAYSTEDHQLFVDDTTGRVFWVNPANGLFRLGTKDATDPSKPLAGPIIVSTGDDGSTWRFSVGCCNGYWNGVLTFAKPRTSTPIGYPNIVYFCVNAADAPFSQYADRSHTERKCEKSLDGGSTWLTASTILSSPTPQHAECAGADENPQNLDGNYPVAAPDGSLYLKVTCGGKTYLARSLDEAATFPILRDALGAPLQIPQLAANSELRADGQGNLYLMGLPADDKLLLTTSTDGGLTWRTPLNVLAPGVLASADGAGIFGGTTLVQQEDRSSDFRVWAFTVGTPGQVAVSYLGQRAGQTNWDGYLTHTVDALSGQPTFWSAMLNDPATPLLYPDAEIVTGNYGNTIGVDIGPDGTPWASFAQLCGATIDAPGCVSQLGTKSPTNNSVGFAGRLLLPRVGSAATRR